MNAFSEMMTGLDEVEKFLRGFDPYKIIRFEEPSWDGKGTVVMVLGSDYDRLLELYSKLKNSQEPLADPTGYPI